MAVHGMPGLEGEGDEGDEAEGEPFPVALWSVHCIVGLAVVMGGGGRVVERAARALPVLDDFTSEVAAVLTLDCDVLVACEGGAEV